MVKVGDRIQLTELMPGEMFNGKYQGIEVGDSGIVTNISKFQGDTFISVDWENGRTLQLILNVDKFKVLES